MQPLQAEDPRTMGAYRLLRRIGSGGMGRVYLGRSPSGRTVAVKAVHPHFATDPEFRVRFRREVDSARRVGGSWTAPVLDADPDAAVPWVATGYVAGPSLQQAVVEHGPLPEATVRALGARLAEALNAVHGLGLVHRDVKPSNVLLAMDGPRLIDFGIARATDGTAALTSTGVSIGSPGYMSPEQVLGRGGVTASSDLFSLGAVLAYAATGTAPFPGDSSAALLYHVVHEDPDLDRLPEGDLRELIGACLAKAAADRPTPEAVVRVLAGGAGAQELTNAGWLPGPLVEEVSRGAVAMLDLEPETADPAAGPSTQVADGASVSGLVPFAEPAQTPSGSPGPTGPGQAQSGAFGPPDASPGSSYEPPRSPGTDGGPGRLSVSAAARRTSSGAAGRQVSCTLVLSVAGVLAAALLSAGLFFDLMPGGGGEQNAGDHEVPPAAQEPSSKTPDADGGKGGTGGTGGSGGTEETPAAVPEAMVGTWQGQLSTDDGLPAGILTVTVTPAEPGDQMATGTFKMAIVGDICSGEWTLKKVTEKELTAVGSSGGGELCTAGESTDTFRLLPDGGLRYASQDETAGNPSGTLSKLG
jgi:eukaryotic-like serine/threonine-protein kinase